MLVVMIMYNIDKKYHYTLVLSPKTYIYNKGVFLCSEKHDIMFASFYAIKRYLGDSTHPKNAYLNNNNLDNWLGDYNMNFILLKKSFSIFPLSNGKIEIKIFDNKKINGEEIKKEINEILKNYKYGVYHKQHIKNYKKSLQINEKVSPPKYKILSESNKSKCDKFFNNVFESYKISNNNLILDFLILFIGLYFFIFSINSIRKNSLFN